MTPDPQDRLYGQPLERVEDFAFDARVAAVFPDMIQRSIPGYTSLIPLLGLVAAEHLQPGSHCYDLGCSLGAASLAIRRHAGGRNDCRILAVDNSLPMLERLRQLLEQQPQSGPPIDLVCADIRDFATPEASVIVLNFTLQFLPPDERDGLLARLCRSLRPGGLLILSEKVRFSDPMQEARFDALHQAYKRANGYSELEIGQKRSALERVLRPDSPERLVQRLPAAGFGTHSRWFQSLNFLSYLAWKD